MTAAFLLGIDAFLAEVPADLRGAAVGVVANCACHTRDGLPTVEAVALHPDLRLSALFVPEHGWRVDSGAGEPVRDSFLSPWKVPLYSLYGMRKGPPAGLLQELDLLLFDLPTLGVRCFTYVSTLRFCMEAAAVAGIPLVVTDRPIPFPETRDGPMLESAQISFIGAIPTPLVYGLTSCEAAILIREHFRLDLDLRICPMTGWPAGADWWPAGLAWRAPSPALRNPESARCYPALVWAEASTAADIGRGTDLAFQVLRWEGMDPKEAMKRMPEPLLAAGAVTTENGGLRIRATGGRSFRPVETALYLMCAVRAAAPDFRRKVDPQKLARLLGSARCVDMLLKCIPPEEIIAVWRSDLDRFERNAQRFLLYPRPVRRHAGKAGGDV